MATITAPMQATLPCPGCGYDLRGQGGFSADEVRCPECGRMVTMVSRAPERPAYVWLGILLGELLLPWAIAPLLLLAIGPAIEQGLNRRAAVLGCVAALAIIPVMYALSTWALRLRRPGGLLDRRDHRMDDLLLAIPLTLSVVVLDILVFMFVAFVYVLRSPIG